MQYTQQDLEPNDGLKEWTKETLRNSSASRIRREDVLRGIREEEERKRRLTGPLDVGTMPTLYGIPAISKEHGTTDKMVAHVLMPPQEDIFVEKTAPASVHTFDLIQSAVDELGRKPMVIVLSKLRWMACEKLLMHFRYYYIGEWIPVVLSREECNFDVRVYGYRI
jgi:hypothetical protein